MLVKFSKNSLFFLFLILLAFFDLKSVNASIKKKTKKHFNQMAESTKESKLKID